ncbi:ATP-dependent zinc protease [Nitrosococcus wardiae]|uniref:ATP-dependent zinc protease family protein n=1 Tax=Nitrosococcus wardiae TaxID=1814290 RepID=UPI001F11363F|nr:RimK/LysX family protein [Nitrosococcus wardiae]
MFGWIELAKFVDWDTVTKVKMDTGALSSSLHATDLEYFQRDDDEWVRFTIKVENQRGEEEWVQQTFERPVYRFVKIISSNGDGDRRPSVLMKLCLGGEIYEEQFTLNDRSDLTYPILFGRRTIEHLGLIDVTRTFTSRPHCDTDAPVHTIENRKLDEDIGI